MKHALDRKEGSLFHVGLLNVDKFVQFSVSRHCLFRWQISRNRRIGVFYKHMKMRDFQWQFMLLLLKHALTGLL